MHLFDLFINIFFLRYIYCLETQNLSIPSWLERNIFPKRKYLYFFPLKYLKILNITIRFFFFKILDYEISFKNFKFFYTFLFFVKLTIPLSIYNFVLYFGMLILCSSETCEFILIKFSNDSLDFSVFVPIDSIPNQIKEMIHFWVYRNFAILYIYTHLKIKIKIKNKKIKKLMPSPLHYLIKNKN